PSFPTRRSSDLGVAARSNSYLCKRAMDVVYRPFDFHKQWESEWLTKIQHGFIWCGMVQRSLALRTGSRARWMWSFRTRGNSRQNAWQNGSQMIPLGRFIVAP